MTGKLPEEWLDQDVLVIKIFIGAVSYQVVARLDVINDQGNVLNGVELLYVYRPSELRTVNV